MKSMSNVIANVLSMTDTSVANDFLNLYPEEVPQNMGNLPEAGFGASPFLAGAMVLIVVSVAAINVRRRRPSANST